MNNNLEAIQKEELKLINVVDKICQNKALKYSLAYGSVLGSIRHSGFIPWDSDIDIMVHVSEYKKFCLTLDKYLPKDMEIKSIYTDDDVCSLKAVVVSKKLKSSRVHIDIYPLANAPKSRLQKDIFFYSNRISYRCFYFKNSDPDILHEDNLYKRLAIKVIKILLYPFPSKLFKKIFVSNMNRYLNSNSAQICDMTGGHKDFYYMDKSMYDDLILSDFEELKLPIPKKYHEYLTSIYGNYLVHKKEDYYV